MGLKINWFGFAGGISLIVLIIVSVFVPWWQLTVGDDLVTANASPLNTNFNFIGDSLTIPLIMALNITSVISLTAAGIVMLIYSVKPLKPYSKKLLGFAYKKPLYSVLLFVIGLILIIIIAGSVFGLDVSLFGSQISTLPADLTQGVTISVSMTAEFQWPLLFALVTAGLFIAARFYHKKILPTNPIPSAVKTPKIINPTRALSKES
jgi:hypothetical protein